MHRARPKGKAVCLRRLTRRPERECYRPLGRFAPRETTQLLDAPSSDPGVRFRALESQANDLSFGSYAIGPLLPSEACQRLKGTRVAGALAVPSRTRRITTAARGRRRFFRELYLRLAGPNRFPVVHRRLARGPSNQLCTPLTRPNASLVYSARARPIELSTHFAIDTRRMSSP
jgi:hypothetical protein